MLQVIAGHDPKDAASRPVSVPDYRVWLRRPVSGMRLGIAPGWFWEKAEGEVAAACTGAASALTALGMTRHEVCWPLVEWSSRVIATIVGAEAATAHSSWLQESLDEYEPFVRERLLVATTILAVDYVQAQRLRRAMLDESLEIFRSVDVVLAPTVLRVAPKWGESTSSWSTHNTAPFNLTGLPAISLPCGCTSAGLPMGTQLIGAPFREATLLQVAAALEQVLSLSMKSVIREGQETGQI